MGGLGGPTILHQCHPVEIHHRMGHQVHLRCLGSTVHLSVHLGGTDHYGGKLSHTHQMTSQSRLASLGASEFHLTPNLLHLASGVV